MPAYHVRYFSVHPTKAYFCNCKELYLSPNQAVTWIRNQGSGRKSHKEIHSELNEALESLVEPVTRGDPESPLLWTCKSTYNLAEALQDKGYKISQPTVYRQLKYW